MNKSGALLLVLIFAYTLAIAQKNISIEDFTIRNTFAEKSVSGINWMNDGKYYTALVTLIWGKNGDPVARVF